ncbi:unnamed protein product [Cylindrotheca closterium]|nr:unnamed protein product [Cylindrotheca closterium]
MIQELPWIENPYDCKLWSIFSGLSCLYFLKAQLSSSGDHHSGTPVGCWQKFRQKFPVGLSLFLLGIILAVMNLTNTRHANTNNSSSDLDQKDTIQFTSEAFVVNALKGATWGDWKTGILEGTLPQLPLTTLNSCLSVCLLAKNLFPDKPVVERRAVSWSIGLMNIFFCPMGSMPHCHGAGGLAGQNKLGAKSGLSMVVLGVFKITLSILAHYGYLLTLFDALPSSILGLLLVIAGHELALTGVSSVAHPKEGTSWTAFAPGKQPDLTVTLMTGLIIVGTGKTHVGTLCGLITYLLHESGHVEGSSNDGVTGDTDLATEDSAGNEEYSPLHRE